MNLSIGFVSRAKLPSLPFSTSSEAYRRNRPDRVVGVVPLAGVHRRSTSTGEMTRSGTFPTPGRPGTAARSRRGRLLGGGHHDGRRQLDDGGRRGRFRRRGRSGVGAGTYPSARGVASRRPDARRAPRSLPRQAGKRPATPAEAPLSGRPETPLHSSSLRIDINPTLSIDPRLSMTGTTKISLPFQDVPASVIPFRLIGRSGEKTSMFFRQGFSAAQGLIMCGMTRKRPRPLSADLGANLASLDIPQVTLLVSLLKAWPRIAGPPPVDQGIPGEVPQRGSDDRRPEPRWAQNPAVQAGPSIEIVAATGPESPVTDLRFSVGPFPPPKRSAAKPPDAGPDLEAPEPEGLGDWPTRRSAKACGPFPPPEKVTGALRAGDTISLRPR